MSYWKTDNRNRTNWNQSLSTSAKTKRPKKIRKSLHYKNVKLLKAFLTKYGKIRPRRKTRISVQQQRLISKAIRKSRAFGIIPVKCDVKI